MFSSLLCVLHVVLLDIASFLEVSILPIVEPIPTISIGTVNHILAYIPHSRQQDSFFLIPVNVANLSSSGFILNQGAEREIDYSVC